MTDWSGAIRCSKETEKKFQRAKSTIRLQEENYNLNNDDILKRVLEEAGY